MTGIDWSERGRARYVAWTVFGTFCCVAIALAVDYTNFIVLSGDALSRALLQNTLLPITLAAPSLYLLTNKIRQLAIAHEQMTILATTDSLTAVLNRGAFTMLVDAYLKQARTRDEELTGALLVVDVDHFKAVNDAFGHEEGDVALQQIARSIKSVLRGADIVGRMGGEEFGVFLPGADAAQAQTIAERVRTAVADTVFAPQGIRRQLTVSVGGATFHRSIGFSDLYRMADQRLYAAKDAGRNRISVAPAELPLAA